MIAVDTNLLVYAHRQDSDFHSAARSRIESLAVGRAKWAVPWPCIHEFLAVVTHPRIYRTPTPMPRAMQVVRAIASLPNLDLLCETDGYLDHLESLALAGRVQGPMVHDTRIAALCLAHGVAELWSADRDFSRFPGLIVRNPLPDPG